MRLTRQSAIRTIAALGPMMLCGARGASAASDAAQMDRDDAAALRKLYAAEHRTVGQKAAGILTISEDLEAGFIFGGQGGKGVLRVHGFS